MRILVDLPEKHLEELTVLSKERKVSRAHLIRCAIAHYLQEEEKQADKRGLEALFGAWKDRNIDGLAYQEMTRKEWDREL